jgi:hypothetical protein
MNDKYIAQIAEELTDCLDWMHESCTANADVTLDELIECSDDIYEVIVDIHLINGDVFTIRNECVRSFEAKKYMGATSESDFSDGNIIAEIETLTPEYHSIRIPLTSIYWIDSHTENIDWETYRQLKEIEILSKK